VVVRAEPQRVVQDPFRVQYGGLALDILLVFFQVCLVERSLLDDMGGREHPAFLVEDNKAGQAAADAPVLVAVRDDQRKSKSGGFLYGFNKHTVKSLGKDIPFTGFTVADYQNFECIFTCSGMR